MVPGLSQCVCVGGGGSASGGGGRRDGLVSSSATLDQLSRETCPEFKL